MLFDIAEYAIKPKTSAKTKLYFIISKPLPACSIHKENRR
jgi:hypothetical protein